MNMQKGFRDRLDKYLDPNRPIGITMQISGAAVYDFTCFGVDAAGKLSDDRYMVFYNQTASPAGEVRYAPMPGGAQFLASLAQLPASVQKLVFTASIDGDGTMGQIAAHTLTVSQDGRPLLELALTGSDFQQEKAVISAELYRKDVWRIAAVAAGFNGGLGDLLRSYGGEEIGTAAPATVPPVPPVQAAPPPVHPLADVLVQPEPVRSFPFAPAPKVSLEKKLETEAPQLVPLAKPLGVQLKKFRLTKVVARVALVLDITGSMVPRYKDGTVQEIVRKALPLAVQFDDDGELDFWVYAKTCRRLPSINMRNYLNAIPDSWRALMGELGGSNYEPVVMQEVFDTYRDSTVPAYVLFITDGGFRCRGVIKEIMIQASTAPIFWQFVGVGGTNYGVLEKLDNMTGRYVDNANFFALDDFQSVGSEELYGRLLGEFPQWLKAAHRKKIIK